MRVMHPRQACPHSRPADTRLRVITSVTSRQGDGSHFHVHKNHVVNKLSDNKVITSYQPRKWLSLFDSCSDE